MGQFVAILRDSFREAVDGFVIYLMLVISAVVILVLGSFSFAPAAADKAIPQYVERFALFVPDRGTARVVMAPSGVAYSASDIADDGGVVRFRLTAKEIAPGDKDQNLLQRMLLNALADKDPFKRAVAAWQKPAPVGSDMKLKIPRNGERPAEKKDKPRAGDESAGFEIVTTTYVTPEEVAAVTDDAMVAFLRDQLWVHMGVTRADISRVKDAPPGTYRFDVVLPGAKHARGWPQRVGVFFGGFDLGETSTGSILYNIQDWVVNWAGSGILLMISTVITAFFVPNMLRKGSLDLLIAKPIGRTRLLLFKYLGGLTFIFILTTITVGGVWLALAVRSGYWNFHFLLTIPVLMFTFALLYAVSTLVGVLTRGPIACILVTALFAGGLYAVGTAKSVADLNRKTDPPMFGDWPSWLYPAIDGLNRGLPRYKDLGKVMSKLSQDGNLTTIEQRFSSQLDYPDGFEVLGVSTIYIAVFLGLACWRLETRDG